MLGEMSPAAAPYVPDTPVHDEFSVGENGGRNGADLSGDRTRFGPA